MSTDGKAEEEARAVSRRIVDNLVSHFTVPSPPAGQWLSHAGRMWLEDAIVREIAARDAELARVEGERDAAVQEGRRRYARLELETSSLRDAESSLALARLEGVQRAEWLKKIDQQVGDAWAILQHGKAVESVGIKITDMGAAQGHLETITGILRYLTPAPGPDVLDAIRAVAKRVLHKTGCSWVDRAGKCDCDLAILRTYGLLP